MIKGISEKKLYMDVCTLCRPFDDQNVLRIRIETDALYLILFNIQKLNYEMIVSPVHFKEIEAIENVQEKLWLYSLVDKYGIEPVCDLSKVRKRAEQLHALKFGVADAAHIAFAEATSHCFITCDDKLLKKCQRSGLEIVALDPIGFCLKEDLR